MSFRWFGRTWQWCVLYLCVATSPTLRAFEVGQWIAVRRDTGVIAADERVDQLVAGQVLRVLYVSEQRVWVSRGRPGWVDVSDVISLERAEAFFNQPFATGAGARDYLARGTVRLALGKSELGIADLKHAVQLANQPEEFLESLGFAYLAANDQAAAIETFSMVLQTQPNSAAAAMGRGLAYYQAGQYEKSETDLLHAIKLRPKHAFPRKYLGAVQHDVRQLDAAEKSLGRAIELDGYDGFSRKAMGRLLFDRGDLQAAQAAFHAAVKIDPHDLEALNGRGVVRHNIGNLEDAENDFSAAISFAEATPENAFLWSNLGQVQEERGQYRAALQNLNRAIVLDPDFNEARSHRAYLLATQSSAFPTVADPMEIAMSDLRAVFISTQPKTYWDYRAVAMVNAQRNDLQRAVRFQQQAVDELRQAGLQRFLEPAMQVLEEFRQRQ